MWLLLANSIDVLDREYIASVLAADPETNPI